MLDVLAGQADVAQQGVVELGQMPALAGGGQGKGKMPYEPGQACGGRVGAGMGDDMGHEVSFRLGHRDMQPI